MGTKTEIEWTDATWWPMKETKQLLQPLSWRKPKRIFVNSMSDLFHENVTDEMRDKIFAVMALCPQHTFQVLTKRPARMLEYFADLMNQSDSIQKQITELVLGVIPSKIYERLLPRMLGGWGGLPLKHVWLGVSVENQATADERIPLLLQTPAAVRFVSAEPLLGPLRLDRIADIPGERRDSLTGEWRTQGETTVYESGSTRLDWVICGGESGPGARPMNPGWARSLRDQCKAAGVPFFFKQWGEWLPAGQGREALLTTAKRHQSLNCPMYRVGKKLAGSLLYGVEHKEFPTQEYNGSGL